MNMRAPLPPVPMDSTALDTSFEQRSAPCKAAEPTGAQQLRAVMYSLACTCSVQPPLHTMVYKQQTRIIRQHAQCVHVIISGRGGERSDASHGRTCSHAHPLLRAACGSSSWGTHTQCENPKDEPS